MPWRIPHIWSVQVMDRVRSIRHNVFSPLQGMRITHWAKGASVLPKLKSLPPTKEAFRENVKRAHFQACLWKACNRIHQSWINLSLVGHLKDHHVHIAHRHYQVELTSRFQINLCWSTAAAAVTGHAPYEYALVRLHSWLVHCSASVKAGQPAEWY